MQDERLSLSIRGTAQGFDELDLPPKAANRVRVGVMLKPTVFGLFGLRITRSDLTMIVACLEAALWSWKSASSAFLGFNRRHGGPLVSQKDFVHCVYYLWYFPLGRAVGSSPENSQWRMSTVKDMYVLGRSIHCHPLILVQQSSQVFDECRHNAIRVGRVRASRQPDATIYSKKLQ